MSTSKHQICFSSKKCDTHNATTRCRIFGPMKRHWREILTDYKTTYSNVSTINKCYFPQLLKELMARIDINKENNSRKGFEASGIFPFNPSRVTVKIPTVQNQESRQFDASLLEFLQRNRRSQPIKTGQNRKLTVIPGKSISTEEAEELTTKAKNLKNDTKITKQIENRDSNLPGPSNITTMKKEKVKHTKTESSGLKRIMPSRQLCIGALNIYLQPLAADLNEFVPVQYLIILPKKSKLNTPFYGDAPKCLQKIITDLPKNNPEPCQNSPNKKTPKIIITSNIVIKEASPEKRIVLRDIDTQINERKRKQTSTPKGQSSKMKRKKKHIICNSDSSLSSNISFHAADDSDYGNFDNYIASCLQEQEE
ncbi:unnamed protein product, partial [Brenthis ino]